MIRLWMQRAGTLLGAQVGIWVFLLFAPLLLPDCLLFRILRAPYEVVIDRFYYTSASGSPDTVELVMVNCVIPFFAMAVYAAILSVFWILGSYCVRGERPDTRIDISTYRRK